MQSTYHIVVLDIEKFRRWLDARNQNGARITCAEVARRIHYSKSYISELMHQDTYNIEVSGRFIGTMLTTFGFNFDEIFEVIPAAADEDVDRVWGTYKYIPRYSMRRQDQAKLPDTWHAV